jgi:hypothetical protein
MRRRKRTAGWGGGKGPQDGGNRLRTAEWVNQDKWYIEEQDYEMGRTAWRLQDGESRIKIAGWRAGKGRQDGESKIRIAGWESG